jgi:hypothetical protein
MTKRLVDKVNSVATCLKEGPVQCAVCMAAVFEYFSLFLHLLTKYFPAQLGVHGEMFSRIPPSAEHTVETRFLLQNKH